MKICIDIDIYMNEMFIARIDKLPQIANKRRD